jgi:hypothetical protein
MFQIQAIPSYAEIFTQIKCSLINLSRSQYNLILIPISEKASRYTNERGERAPEYQKFGAQLFRCSGKLLMFNFSQFPF